MGHKENLQQEAQTIVDIYLDNYEDVDQAIDAYIDDESSMGSENKAELIEQHRELIKEYIADITGDVFDDEIEDKFELEEMYESNDTDFDTEEIETMSKSRDAYKNMSSDNVYFYLTRVMHLPVEEADELIADNYEDINHLMLLGFSAKEIAKKIAKTQFATNESLKKSQVISDKIVKESLY